MYTITVPFYDDELYVVEYNNEPYVPMRPIVEGMGLAWQSQLEKIKQRFKSTITEIVIVAADGKKREMTCLALRKLAGWLATISPNKVKPEIRGKVIRYQDKCDDVLYEYWTKGVVVNPRKRSVMEELNQACAELKRDKQIASVFGTGLNEWKKVKLEHESKIRGLVGQAADLVLDLVLAETGKGKITRTESR
ncbi:phage antirepressor N-terminal domain-containing protein [Xenorhabdus hominickii]|uniref:Antirepressor n=1 Tax=Xenorhabdus hominickii TaxID=351679 RepID=A0A2G0Q628_XENHO|nr:phage antirepressor N-terminal domain-containing protein [Xenorhabdus hominickii]AOM39558.1 antirepressor [Xenorhabdus hominickii]PHM54663.1 antirepressor [Xenorhabdus hominickii]